MKMQWVHRIALLGMMIMPVLLFAQTEYGIQESIDLAMQNNASLQQQQLTLESARLKAQTRWNVFLPSIDLSTSISNQNAVISDTDSSTSLSMSGSASLSLSLGLPAEQKTLVLSYEQALLAYEQEVDDLEYSVKDAFYQLLLSASQLEVYKENLDLVSEQVNQSRIQFENGYVDESDYLQSRLEMENARLDYNQELADYELAVMSLKNTLGIDLDEDVNFTGEISSEEIELPLPEALYAYIDGRIDVLSASYDTQLAQLALQIARSGRLPSLSVSGGWDFSKQLFEDSDLGDSLSLSLGLSFPLDSWISGSDTNVSIREAQSEIESLEIEESSLRSSAEYEIQSLVSTVNQAAIQMQIAQLQVDIAEQSYDLSEEGFASGTVEQLELETARADLLEARMSLLDSQYSYAVGIMDLESALNLDEISQVMDME